MGLTNRLLASAQALAAVAARVRLEDLALEGDPAVRAQLDRVVDALGVRDDVEALDERERAVVVAFARSYLAQALDLIDDPARKGAWSYSDPTLLRAQGSASAAVVRLIAEAGLGSADARILDVGTGVGGLAIAFCTTFPEATVVGIDPWEPALAIARESVAAAGLEDRITLRADAIQEFEDDDGFDLAWLPSFVIPEAVLDEAIERIFAVTRPGGRRPRRRRRRRPRHRALGRLGPSSGGREGADREGGVRRPGGGRAHLGGAAPPRRRPAPLTIGRLEASHVPASVESLLRR